VIINGKSCFLSANETVLAFRVTVLLHTMASGARRALWSLQRGRMGKRWILFIYDFSLKCTFM